MEKKKFYTITGLCITVGAALYGLLLRSPRNPVILTYQVTAPAVTEQETAPQTAAETICTTAPAITTASETALVETTAPLPLCTDLNEASAEDLMRVNGIGEKLAAAIIQYRDGIGGFRRRSELLEISGIGEATMAQIMSEFVIPDELPPLEEAPEPEMVPEPEPEPEPEPHAEAENEPEPEPVGPFDVNHVTREELLRIPEMTEELADEILELREKIGGFQGIYELMLVEKLSGRYFEDTLKQYLYVENDPYSVAAPACPERVEVPPADL